jgi:hypothetical protein
MIHIFKGKGRNLLEGEKGSAAKDQNNENEENPDSLFHKFISPFS